MSYNNFFCYDGEKEVYRLSVSDHDTNSLQYVQVCACVFVSLPTNPHLYVCCVWRQQELSNLLHGKKYLKALGLAISLDQPHTVLTVIKGTDSVTRIYHTLVFSVWLWLAVCM